MSKIPKCPNCKQQMVFIWYLFPDERIKKFVDEKRVYYKGLESIKIDRESPERIIYHCYNCNRSYSKNLKKYDKENKSFNEIMEQTQKEVDDIINMLADEIINNLDDNIRQELKKKSEYNHFGFGLYIRNNYIYNNEKIKYRFEADDLSSMIYDKIIEKLSEK